MFLTPASILLNRLTYAKKFLVVGAISVLACGVTLYQMAMSDYFALEGVKIEKAGVKFSKPIYQLILAMQVHRGLSQRYIAGDKSLENRLREKQTEITQLLEQVDVVVKNSQSFFDMGVEASKIKSTWSELQAVAFSLKPEDSFAQHTNIILALSDFLVNVADVSTLSLDPDADAYYLIQLYTARLPFEMEKIAKMRGLGAGALQKKEISGENKGVLLQSKNELDSDQRFMVGLINQIAKASPESGLLIKPLFEEFLAATKDFKLLTQHHVIQSEFGMTGSEFFDAGSKAIKQAEIFAEKAISLTDAALDNRVKRIQQHFLLSVGLSAGLLLLAGYFSIAVMVSLMDALKELKRIALSMREGDLRVSSSLSGSDEIVDIVKELAATGQQLKDFMVNIQRDGASINTASRAVASLAASSSHTANEQSDAASSVVAAIEELSTSIAHLSDHATQADQISAESDALSKQSGETIVTAGQEIGQLSGVVVQASHVIQSLGEKSEQITEIVQVIREIAEQTNLLALNAAIEAARAGEQGRGFAVVADEVRKLAERTSESTQQITGMIQAVQAGVKDSVVQMQHAVECVGRSVHLTKEAETSVRSINKGATHLRQLVGDISNALMEQSSSSQDIARNIERITSMISDSQRGARENYAAADGLEKLADELLNSVSIFKT